MDIQSLDSLGKVLARFGIDASAVSIIQVKHGLINNTWKVEQGREAYILQKINHAIFKKPEEVAYNISSIAHYLSQINTGYTFPAPLKTISGDTLYREDEEHCYRLFSFVKDSHTKSTVDNVAQAYEAAKQFGKFTSVLTNFDALSLKIILPSFHDLEVRYEQFLQALNNGNRERIKTSAALISELKAASSIAAHFQKIKKDPAFAIRVTHHDTKISNVLFDRSDKGICVIDLDTVMPGYFISDVGDMMRTYLCPVSEEEEDLTKISVRPEIFTAIIKGYQEEMGPYLTATEQQHFFYAGRFMIYMQALRFLTDHLTNDRYYGASYPGQNYVRAANQAALLKKYADLQSIVH